MYVWMNGIKETIRVFVKKIFSVWCENVDEDKAVKNILRDVFV
jgi:hypothetical protein